MGVPAGEVVDAVAEEQLGTKNDIFEDFVEGVSDVERTVGVGWSIVEDK